MALSFRPCNGVVTTPGKPMIKSFVAATMCGLMLTNTAGAGDLMISEYKRLKQVKDPIQSVAVAYLIRGTVEGAAVLSTLVQGQGSKPPLCLPNPFGYNEGVQLVEEHIASSPVTDFPISGVITFLMHKKYPCR
jgi:hypothetical protein